MTIRPLPLIAALWLAAMASGAWAQTAGSPAKPATTTAKPAASNGKAASAAAVVVKPAPSAPVQVKRQTRPLTSAEKLESVAPPGELRPERIVTPQLTIPLGKTPPDSTHQPTRSSGKSVDDSAGRCAAIADENERAMCREAAGLGKPKK